MFENYSNKKKFKLRGKVLARNTNLQGWFIYIIFGVFVGAINGFPADSAMSDCYTLLSDMETDFTEGLNRLQAKENSRSEQFESYRSGAASIYAGMNEIASTYNACY